MLWVPGWAGIFFIVEETARSGAAEPHTLNPEPYTLSPKP